jgi:hypothetical protein
MNLNNDDDDDDDDDTRTMKCSPEPPWLPETPYSRLYSESTK